MDVRSVIIDTDCALGAPGAKVDDGFALALAFASPELTVRLVTTTAGNVDVLTATARTRSLLELLDRADVSVAAGGVPDGGAAARHIASQALAAPGGVTVVALGPLVNVAAALAADPAVSASIAEVVVMGGRFFGPAGAPPEFNTRDDPWAARALLDSGVRVRLVGLDVTARLALGPTELDRLSRGGKLARHLADLARARLARLAADGAVGCPMHDPLAVLALTHPELVTFAAATLEVDLGPGPGQGRTSARLLGDGSSGTTWVAVDVEARQAQDVLVARLAGLP